MSKWGQQAQEGVTKDMGSINLGGEFTEEQWRFGQAMERYKRRANRPFPTWLEVLNVAKHELGYRKVS